jgi:hypothetical protein
MSALTGAAASARIDEGFNDSNRRIGGPSRLLKNPGWSRAWV